MERTELKTYCSSLLSRILSQMWFLPEINVNLVCKTFATFLVWQWTLCQQSHNRKQPALHDKEQNFHHWQTHTHTYVHWKDNMARNTEHLWRRPDWTELDTQRIPWHTALYHTDSKQGEHSSSKVRGDVCKSKKWTACRDGKGMEWWGRCSLKEMGICQCHQHPKGN